jgi:Amt family ammonium transporter
MDDTLDVVGVHGVGGITGLVMVGLFATARISGQKGLFYGGGWDLLGKQVVAILAMAAFSFILSWLLAKLVQATVGFRADAPYEAVPGASAEEAYDTLTADRLGSLVHDKAVRGDSELVARIAELIRTGRHD